MPEYTIEGRLPGQSGIPRAVQDAQAIPNQPASQELGTILGKGVATLGEGLVNAAGIEVRKEELAARVAKADNLLISSEAFHKYQQERDRRIAALSPEDWRTRPEQVLAIHQEVQAQFGQGLSPQAQALYREASNQAFTLTQQEAIKYKTASRDRATQGAIATEMQDAVKGMLGATDPVARQYHRIRFEAYTQQAMETGLITPAGAADAVAKVTDAVVVGDWERRIRLNAFGSLGELKGLAEAGTTHIGTTPIATLIDHAEAQLVQEQTVKRHSQTAAQQAFQDKQKQFAGVLRGELFATDPTPENLPALRSFLNLVTRYVETGVLRAEDADTLQSGARAAIDKALQPAVERDDQAAEREVALAITLARNDEDLTRAQDILIRSMGVLKRETYMSFHARIETARTSQQLLSNPEYREGQRIIERGATGGVASGPLAILSLGEDKKLEVRHALDAYESTMLELWRQDPQEAFRQARPRAYQARTAFVKEPASEGMYWESLFDTWKTEDVFRKEMRARIEAGLSKAEAVKMEDRWNLFLERKKAEAEALRNKPPTGRKK